MLVFDSPPYSPNLLTTVQVYMAAIQDTAELAIRNLFKRIAQTKGTRIISAVDYMDDGTPVALKIALDGEDGSATFDFTGTGPEVLGECRSYIAHRFQR